MEATYKAKNILATTLVAGLAGAAAGLLLAPRSGKETRHQLRASAIQAKQKTQAGLHSLQSSAGQAVDKVKGAKDQVIESVKNIGATAKNEFQRTKDEINDPSTADTGLGKEV